MEIVRIFANLYSFRYENQQETEYARLFQDWNDIEFLYEFFEENKEDFKVGYHGQDIDSTILKTRVKAQQFQTRLLQYSVPEHSLNDVFKPLDQTIIKQATFNRSKAYGTGDPSLLRLYALKISEGVYVITGGAIKLTRLMQDAEHLQKELRKLESCRHYLHSLGIVDLEGFMELF
jgi:hypothetical protein